MIQPASATGGAVRGVADPDPAADVKLICAWCGGTIKDGMGPVSHGICDSCARMFEAPRRA